MYLLGIAIGCFLPLVYSDQRFPMRYAVAFLLFYSNWLISLTGFPLSVTNPLWSVSFEEQFYLLWPVVVGKVRRKGSLLAIATIMVIAALAARLILLRYGRHSETAIFTNTIARLDPLACGIATAVLFRDTRIPFTRLVRFGLFFLGSALCLLAGHAFALSHLFSTLGYPTIALGVWCIFMSVFGLEFAPGWLRGKSPTVFMCFIYSRYILRPKSWADTHTTHKASSPIGPSDLPLRSRCLPCRIGFWKRHSCG